MTRSLATFAAALALAAALPGPALAAGRTTVEDDWPGALALAKERSVPIVVDVWAPW